MTFQTEYEFSLPIGYVDSDGNLHKQGIMRLATDSPSSITAMRLKRLIDLERKRHTLAGSLRLPHFISSVGDLDAFQLLQW